MQENIDYSSPNDGLGDKLRNAFIKVQNNFTELYNGKVDKIAGKGLSKNDFTDADKAKLDGIETGAEVNVQSDWGETDPLSDSFILNKPPALYSAFGYFHVADLATQTTPLAFLAATPLQLTNDGGGAFTNYEQAPYGVSSIWNTSTNKFEFEKLSVGDAILISADLSISTTSVNQNLRLYIKLGIGTPSERDLLIDSWNEKSVVTFEEFIKDVSFSIDNEDWRDAPAEIYILSDDDGSVKVNGWYVPIIRKSVNVIDIQGSQSLQQVTDIGNATTNYIEVPMLRLKEGALEVDLSSVALTATRELFAPDKNGTIATEEDTVAKVSTSGVERAYIINADGSQGTKPTIDFKDVLEFANLAAFPVTGESGKIYVALNTNFTYRWTGSVYVKIGGINQDLYPIKYWYQATGGVLQTYGTNAILASGTQSDVVGVVSYRKYLTTTALGNLAVVREGSFPRINSNRGFHYEMRFKLENTASASDWRGLFGFRTTNAPTNINPTDDPQPLLGIGADSGDTNLFLISKFGTIVKVDTGISKSTTDELHLEIKRLNGTNTNELTLKNLSTGDAVTTVFDNGNITTITNYVSNNTSAKAIGFSIQRIRLNISE